MGLLVSFIFFPNPISFSPKSENGREQRDNRQGERQGPPMAGACIAPLLLLSLWSKLAGR
jgi:hypothetical protein